MEKLRKRLGEIAASLKTFQELDGLAPEQTTEVTALTSEFATVKNQIEAKDAINAALDFANKTPVAKTAVVNTTTTVSAPEKMQNGNNGFDSMGEFFMAIKNDPKAINNDNLKIMANQREKVGEEGGFLVGEDLIGLIDKKIQGDESLLSRCRQLTTGSNRITMNVDENAPWTGAGSNFDCEWVGEEKTATESKKLMKEVDIKLHKVAAKIAVTDEMLEDAPLIESIINQDAPEVIMAKINDAIISGNGVKKPQGILGSGFGFEVAKEIGQAAGTIEFNNLKKLYTHALPKAKRNGVFLYNVACEEQLIGMKLDASSTDSPSVYLPNQSIAGAPYGTLWGKPVFPMAGALPALGAQGDILFADLSNYFAAVKSGGLKRQISIHAKWDEDATSYKFSFRIGGMCPYSSPASTQYGNYKLSGLLYLQERV